MDREDKVLSIIYHVIDELNLNYSSDKIQKKLEAKLTGEGGILDSLGLVELLVQIEEKLYTEFQISLNLSDTKRLSSVLNPFLTVGTLKDHILHQLE